MIRELTLEGIGALDEGRVAVAVTKELMQIAHDVKNRPADSTSRDLVLKVKFIPVTDQVGHLCGVDIRAFIHSSLPKRRTEATRANIRTDEKGYPAFYYNDAAPEDPNQQTFDMVSGEVKEADEAD